MVDRTMALFAVLGHALVGRFASLTLTTGALLLGAVLLDRALARRTRAAFRVALYLPIALRVLLPLDLGLGLGLVRTPAVDALVAPALRIDAGSSFAEGAAHAPSWQVIAAIFYLAVAALLALRAVVARARLARALASATPIASPVEAAPCPVLVHDTLGPMAFGAISPRIVLPRYLVGGDARALACVLRHEIAHVRRGDAWLSLGMQIVVIAAWPVVPAWLASARVRRLIELACDEAAVAHGGEAERLRYGHALLDIAQAAEQRSFDASALGAGELHFGSTLRARIEALASSRPWPRLAQALVLALAPVALFAACGGSSTPAATAATPASGSREPDRYGYQFETDSPKLASTEKRSGPEPARDHGRLPPETIQAQVRASFAAFRACYEAGLQRDPKLTGRVSVKYTIAEDGTTHDAADDASTLADKAVVACVVEHFGRITYPKPEGGIVTVVYPIEFTPGD